MTKLQGNWQAQHALLRGRKQLPSHALQEWRYFEIFAILYYTSGF